MGPLFTDSHDEDHLLATAPSKLFPTGLLYPLSDEELEVEPDDDGVEDDKQAQNTDVNREAKPVRRHGVSPPSSAGMSFFASSDIRLCVFPDAVRYENQNSGKHAWKRIPLTSTNEEQFWAVAPPVEHEKKFEEYFFWGKRAKLTCLWRPFGQGWIVTVSLCNIQKISHNEKKNEQNIENEQNILFETGFRCEITNGEIYPYPRQDISLMEHEEVRLEIQYWHKKIFAIGHGTAVDWDIDPQNERPANIWIDFLPKVEVPLAITTNDKLSDEMLDIQTLSQNFHESRSLLELLNQFVNTYEEWHKTQQNDRNELDDKLRPYADKIVEEQALIIERMRTGIKILKHNRDAARAFSWTNQVMLRQMQQADIKNKFQTGTGRGN